MRKSLFILEGLNLHFAYNQECRVQPLLFYFAEACSLIGKIPNINLKETRTKQEQLAVESFFPCNLFFGH